MTFYRNRKIWPKIAIFALNMQKKNKFSSHWRYKRHFCKFYADILFLAEKSSILARLFSSKSSKIFELFVLEQSFTYVFSCDWFYSHIYFRSYRIPLLCLMDRSIQNLNTLYNKLLIVGIIRRGIRLIRRNENGIIQVGFWSRINSI